MSVVNVVALCIECAVCVWYLGECVMCVENIVVLQMACAWCLGELFVCVYTLCCVSVLYACYYMQSTTLLEP